VPLVAAVVAVAGVSSKFRCSSLAPTDRLRALRGEAARVGERPRFSLSLDSERRRAATPYTEDEVFVSLVVAADDRLVIALRGRATDDDDENDDDDGVVVVVAVDCRW